MVTSLGDPWTRKEIMVPFHTKIENDIDWMIYERERNNFFLFSLFFHLKLFSVCGSRSPALKKEASRQLRVEFVIRRYWYSFSPLMFQGLEERGGHFLCMCVCCFRSRSARVVLHSREPCYLAIG